MPDVASSIKLTVEEKVCLHLLDYIHVRDEFLLPEDISQNGIAEATGVQRGHASVALISLKKKELVTEKVSRVSGSTRRKKVYFLTKTGLDEALKTKKMLEETSVMVSVGGEEKTISFREINRLSGRKLSLVKILDVLSENEGTLDLESLATPPELPRKEDKELREGESAPPPEDTVSHPEMYETPQHSFSQAPPLPFNQTTPMPAGQAPPPPPDHHPQPPHYATSGPAVIVISKALKSIVTGVGVVFSIFCLSFLSLYFIHDNNIYLAYSLLSLFFSLLLLQFPLALEFHSPGPGGLRLERCDMLILGFSLTLLSVFAHSLEEEQFFADELFRAVLVIIPLLLILNVKNVVPEHIKPEIAGIVGTLFVLYGSVQGAGSGIVGMVHYPFLWILSGVIIIVTVYSSLPGEMEQEKKQREQKLLVAACTGSGIFILIALLAGYQRMSNDPLGSVLLVLWLLFALVLCSLRWWKAIEEDIKNLIISSIFVVMGVLFFFAAGIFFSLEKHIEGAVEILVGLVILRFSLNYLKLSKEHLFFTALFAVLGILSVYDFYTGM